MNNDKKILIVSIVSSILFCVVFFGFFIWFVLVGYRYTDYYKAREYDNLDLTYNLSTADVVSYDFQYDSSIITIPVIAFSSDSFSSSVVSSNSFPSFSNFSFRYNHFVDNSWSLRITCYDLALCVGDNVNKSTSFSSPSVTSQVLLDNTHSTTSWEPHFFGSFAYTDINNNYNNCYLAFNSRVYNTPSILTRYSMTLSTGINGQYSGCVLTLYFDNNTSIVLQFPTQKNSLISFYNFSTLFWPSNRVIVVSDLTDNDYYQQGKSDGLSEGESRGIDIGYQRGLREGESIGDAIGYQRGVNEAHSFTFMNLFGALFDVPIQIITGFLNYELFGFNLLNLATGILTFVIIIKILRYMLGGK